MTYLLKNWLSTFTFEYALKSSGSSITGMFTWDSWVTWKESKSAVNFQQKVNLVSSKLPPLKSLRKWSGMLKTDSQWKSFKISRQLPTINTTTDVSELHQHNHQTKCTRWLSSYSATQAIGTYRMVHSPHYHAQQRFASAKQLHFLADCLELFLFRLRRHDLR